jgi:hypothetical protein
MCYLSRDPGQTLPAKDASPRMFQRAAPKGDGPVLAQNSNWRDWGQGRHRAASHILRSPTLIAMMQAANLREGNNVSACEG